MLRFGRIFRRGSLDIIIIPVLTAMIGFGFMNIFSSLISDFSTWTLRMNAINPYFPYIPVTGIYLVLITLGVVLLTLYIRLIRRGR